jgi:DNA polymerase III epsilon subunit-like protein
VSNDNSFANKAIDKFLLSKDASLSISLPSIKADNPKPKDEPADKKITAEKESKAQSAYEDYLENWQQGDPIPLMPPGKEFILCRVDLNPMAAKREAGYHDVPELTKKPYKKVSPEEQLIEFKNLGPKLSSSLTSLLGRVAKSRGLWVDDKNKLRCPPGSPAANQFTDITGSNCFIPSPQTAAGSARRAVRRAVNGADILSSPLGGRTDTSFAGTEQRVQRYTTDDFGMVHAAMGVGGRIGMPNSRGPVWNRGPAVRGAKDGGKSWHNGSMEMRERGRIATTQADVLHRRLMGQSEPLGLTRQARRTLRAMDRQIASPSNYLLPSGNPVGDILNKGNFMRAMTEIMPNVDPNEFDVAFESAIPAGLTIKERLEAQIVARTFFEGLIFEAIQNPQHFKWVTQFNTGQVKGDPSAAFEVKLQQFAPSPLSGSRRAGVAVTNLARSSGSGVGETGGLHVSMTYNPLMSYLYAKDFMKTKFSDGSGQSDSIQGKALYLAVHETGHLVDFSEKLKALGLDPTRLSRYGTSTTLVSTPSGPARQPNFYSNGWNIDWSMVSNPTGNASVQEMIDAATSLQTTSYTGGRFGGRRIDLQDDLNKFHLGFSDAFTNNINTTEEEHKLMAMFAGGDYAASSPIEARAEFYVTSRLFGESTKFPDTVYPPLGPMKTGIAEMNLVEKFAQSEGRRRATQEAEDGLISFADVDTRTVALASDVLSELRDLSRNTYGVRAGGWNVSGLMSTPERNGRVSLHARRVQDLVAATEIQTQRRKRGTNIPSGVSGKMSTPEIRKPSRPREPDNGPYTGRFLEIFNGVKDFADFRDRYRKEDIIYFDYETTGFGADGNMPVQIGAVRMRGGQVVERFNVFVNPGIPLGEWAQKNLKDGSGNPLTDDWLAQQESLKGAHEKLIEFFGEDALIGGQYTPFDLEVFERVTKDLGISYKPGGVIDSKALADETLPRWTPDKPDGPTMVDPKTGDKKGSNSLGPLAEYLGVDLGDGWHTADADAEASALVTERMLDRAVANPDTTPRTILDPDEIPNIVERRRKKYKADMEQYERDKIDYEAGISGKMSVPQFETANGSTYERQPDGRYKRRKDPVRSTTIDGPVEKIQKKTSAEDIAKDAASAEKFRAEQKRLESMSDGELDNLFSDGEYTYVVHFGAEEIAGGEMDPARSVGAGDSFDADTRGINKTYSDAFISQYNTEKATAEHVSSVVDTLKNGEQINSPISGTVLGTALSPYDSIYSGYYMKKGARRDRFSQDRDRPWPDADDLTEMGMTREELIDSLEKNTVPVLEDRWRPKTETVKKLESNEGQFTSAFTVAGVVSGKDNPEAYGGRYSEGYDAATADRQDRINSFAQNPRMGIHILRVKIGEDATRLGFGNKTQREVHMLGKHKVVASMATPTWGKRVDLEGRDFYKGWMADVVEKDKAARAAEAAGKPVDVVETTFDNTVFLTPDAKYAVALAADRGRHLNSNGDLMGLSYDDRNLNTAQLLKLQRDGAKFDEAFEKSGGVISHFPINRSEIRESPQVGLHPFEWDNDGRKTHTGSPVSSVTRRPGNDVDQTPSAGSGVSGKMTTAQAETRKSTVDDKLARYRKAVQEYDEKGTGEWNGAEHGVVTALPAVSDAALHLDRVDIPPKNLNLRDIAAKNADEKGLTGAEKEKFIADELKTRRADMDRKIQFLEREQKLAEKLIASKRVRSEQNVLDIEDISPEEIEKLKAEAAEIRRLKASDSAEDRERFTALFSDGETRYVTHAGESELKGGVLQGSSSIGAESSYTGGTGGGSGDTRGLNNEVVAGMKGRVSSWEKSVSILDKAIAEAENDGTFTYRDIGAEFAFRGIGDFDRRVRQSDFGTVFNVATDMGFTKEQWIEKLKVQRNALAKELEIEKNILSRIEKDEYQFLSAETAERFADAGMGYFGRYSHRQIPAEISKNLGGGTDIAAGMGLAGKEIKDPEMAERWLDSLRGTVWVAKGKRDFEWTNRLGPALQEVQILGKTKPIVGFSSKKNDKNLLEEIMPALLARAINDDKNNGGTIRPLAVAGRVDASSGVSGKMSTLTPEQMTVRNESIIKGIEENGGSWGDFVPDSYRENIGEIDAASWAAGGQFNVQKPLTKEQTQKDIDSFVSRQYQEIQAHLRGEKGDFRFINYDVNFLEHIRQMTPEQFAQEVRDANISFHAGIDPRVRVQVPIPELTSVLANGYRTTHELRSDHSGKSIRLPYEASIGIHPKTPVNLRPASGYIVHQDWLEAELQAASKDIEAQGLENTHPELLASGQTSNLVKAGRGPVELYGGIEVILRPEVAERTRYLHGDSLNTKGSPTPMTGTDITSIQKGLMINYEAGNTLTELLYGHWSKNHAASHRHMIRDAESMPKGAYYSGPETWKNENYMEALIAGSFDSGDIEEVVMPNLDYVPYNWISGSESRPPLGRAQQTYGGQVETGRVFPPAINHLRDEKILIEKLGFTPEEAKIGARIAKEKFFVESGQPALLRREAHLFAAIAMKETLEKKGIKFTVKHSKGYDVFDPKTVYSDAPDGATVKEAIVLSIEEFLKRMVREEIAEAGRKAQQQASSSEKAVV